MSIADWLATQVEAKNFGAAAIYDEIADPDCDRDFCLSILQAMEDKGWQWNCT